MNAEYLSVSEYAELRGVSIQGIQKAIKDGKLEAETVMNEKNRPKYLIPVAAIPENLRNRYYKDRAAEMGLQPERKETAENAVGNGSETVKVKRSLDSFTAAERAEIALWSGIIREWKGMRSQFKSKVEADRDYCGKMRLEHPGISISPDILYRKYKAWAENDLEGLTDGRGGWNKGKSGIDEEVWKLFTRLWLVPSQPKVAASYRDLKNWLCENLPEKADIPSCRSFDRRIKSEIPMCVIDFCRNGKKECFDKYVEYIDREYADLDVNEIWIADNHTLDILSVSEEGQVHRLTLTAFMDAKSGVIVGWFLGDNPCSQSTLLAIRAAAMRGYGLPFGFYMDNGSEFLTHDIGGRGHRKKADWNAGDDPPTILAGLGITMINALVKNAKAKPIERYFFTFKEFISKATEGYCGGTPAERKHIDGLNQRVKEKRLPTDQEIHDLLELLIDGGYNAAPYGGKEREFKGMSRQDVWNRRVNAPGFVFRDASDDDLAILLNRVSRYQKIKRNGVFLDIGGKRVWYKNDETALHIGKEVYIKYDPADYTKVRIYDKETDAYLWTYESAEYLSVDYNVGDSAEGRDKLAEALASQRRTQKFIRRAVEEYTSDERIDVLKARIIAAENGMKTYSVQRPAVIHPITAPEVNAENPGRENIVSVKFAEYKAMKAMNDNLTRTG